MKTLIEGYSPDYSYKASKLTGRPNRITVEVEDTIDAAFWGDLLQSVCPDKEYHFKPFHTVISHNEEKTSKGKSGIMKMCHELNAYHIGCIDADNDWILSSSSRYGDEILNNRFLLHTYAYSIENLLCEPQTFPSLCKSVTQENTDVDFENYILQFSTIVYPLLIWTLFFESRGVNKFAAKQWQKLLNSDYSNVIDSLRELEKRVKDRLDEVENTYKDSICDRYAFEVQLKQQKSISSANAFLYVYGHGLFSYVLHHLLKPIADKLQKGHIRQLQEESVDDEIGIKIGSYVSSCLSLETELYRNYRFKCCSPIYSMIVSDIQNIWK